MDLDSDYYSSRCIDINDLWLFKEPFMAFVGGHRMIKHYSILT
jgi:hypothetical protein